MAERTTPSHGLFTSRTSGVSTQQRARTPIVRRLMLGGGSWGPTSARIEARHHGEGIEVQGPRFVFLAAPMQQTGGATDGIIWMLVSPNNRTLGQGTVYHEVYSDCRQSVLHLQANADRVLAVQTTVERTGSWTWRIDLDGTAVAVSSRSYLRARECAYNLDRFMEAVPNAEIVPGTRSARRGRRRVSESEPVVSPRHTDRMRSVG